MKSVTPYCGLYTEAQHSRQVVFGVAEQLLAELRAIGGVVEQVRFRGVAALHDPEAVKRCLDVIAKRSGVDVFCDPFCFTQSAESSNRTPFASVGLQLALSPRNERRALRLRTFRLRRSR
jgi:hypothetical protein